MDTATPSRTALGVAIRRASHQLYDSSPLILNDPIAVPMLGSVYRDALEKAVASADDHFSISMRAWLVARSRYAEDKLSEGVQRGVRQYVLLGAGLDTFAYRNPHANLSVFEVDHPATQEWKRRLLASNGLEGTDRLQYVAVDFERQSLATELLQSGLDPALPTVFAWLGVLVYLTHPAFRLTLDFIATFSEGSGVIMDYALPRQALSCEELEDRDKLAARVGGVGEPFQLFFSPTEMASELSSFSSIEDLNTRALNARYFTGRTDRLSLNGRSGHIVSAWR